MEHDFVALDLVAIARRLTAHQRPAASAAFVLWPLALGRQAEERKQPATVVYLRLLPLGCMLALPRADGFGSLHLVDALLSRLLVVEQGTAHLGDPAVDRRHLGVVRTFRAVAPDVPLQATLVSLTRQREKCAILTHVAVPLYLEKLHLVGGWWW